MISALAFTRDRPAQLDLLLQSLLVRWPETYKKTAALFRATESRYDAGYDQCSRYHPQVPFIRERDFQTQVLGWVPREGCAVLLCDDDVLYRPFPPRSLDPEDYLTDDQETLCFSLRLGANTRHCYSLRDSQAIPFVSYGRWAWRDAEHDFSYPGSCDGHVFRAHQLRTLLAANRPTWASPNELEDHLNRACQTALLPFMRCYEQSVLTGLPLNTVQEVYKPNRHAETHAAPLATLNRHFLEGRRLSLDSVDAAKVDAAHCEVRLLWQPEAVLA